MKSAGKARNNGLYRHIRTSKEIIRNLLNDSDKFNPRCNLNRLMEAERHTPTPFHIINSMFNHLFYKHIATRWYRQYAKDD